MKKTTLIILPLVCLVLILTCIFERRMTSFLSETRRVNANLMIVDGWMRLTTVDNLKEEIQNDNYDKILVAGIRSTNLDFYKLAMNGFLIFYPQFQELLDKDIKEHSIEIVTRSKMGGIYKCHFYFYINDSIAGEFYSEAFENVSYLKWEGSLKDIDSMMVQFTNDMYDNYGDRDLFIKEIRIDSTIVISYQHNTVTDFGQIGGLDRIVNDYDSHPQIIRNKIYSFGIDTAIVTAITLEHKRFNRTLSTALAVRRWIENSGHAIEGINVVSMGIHSKRTWRTYRSVLNKSIDIGYISLPDYRDSDSKARKVLRTITESIDYLYYCIILIPYGLNLL